jgi:hypothetical protein
MKRTWLVVVGVAKYKGGAASLTSLPGVMGDALSFDDSLHKHRSHATDTPFALTIRLFNEKATRSAILGAIAEVAARANESDQVVFYFAGHGWQEDGGDSPMPDGMTRYLLPFDATERTAAKRGISTGKLASALAPVGACELLVVLDCCHSGGLTGVFLSGFGDLQQGQKSRCVIAAAQPIELALETDRGGLFTQSFSAALAGQVPLPASLDGWVTAAMAYEYAEQAVRRTAQALGRRQETVMWGYGQRIPLTHPHLRGQLATRLHERALFAELARRSATSPTAHDYCQRLDAAVEAFHDYLPTLRLTYHHFADHCYSHAVQIADVIGRILTPAQVAELSCLEIYLLLSACLLQDVAVVLAPDEVLRLAGDDVFARERQAVLKEAGLPPSGVVSVSGVDRLLAADYLRRHGNGRCAFAIDRSVPPYRVLVGDDRELGECLERIIRGQALPFSDLCTSADFPINERVGVDGVNVLFLTICLRVGALLDVKTPRVSPVLRYLSEPRCVLAASHWGQYSEVKVRGVGPRETIEIGGTSPSQNAERLLREWVRWLQDECEHAVLTLNSGPLKYSLHVGRIECVVAPACDPRGVPLYEFHNFRFNLDEEQVFKRLFGHRLYGRVDAALRELIQNGVDATRVRVALECSARPDWPKMPAVARLAAFRKTLGQRAASLALCVRQEVRHDPTTGESETWLHIADQGVGMTREVIERFLLKVGRSRWREDPAVRALGIGTIGEFGVGFLSCFMMSERIVVETQSCLPNEEGIRATIYNWRGYLMTEPAHPGRPGTCISLRLKPEVAAGLRPITEAVADWCPFLELPIRVIDADGKEVELDLARGGRRSKRLEMFCFAIGEHGSLAAIRETKQAQREATAPALCQDGLVVPDVPPPILERPDQQILRQYSLRVNLCGGDRLPLDLSRNLIEGGADALWARLVPEVWRGMVKNGLLNRGAQSAFAEYVQAEFEESLGEQAFFVGPDGRFVVAAASAAPPGDTLEFVDKNDKEIHRRAWSGAGPLLVLPEVPGPLYYGWRNTEGYDIGWEKGDAVVEAWRHRGLHHVPYHKQDNPGALSLRALTSYGGLVFRSYPYLVRGETGAGTLVCRKVPGAVPLTSLGFWRLSREWLAIRSPVDGTWQTVHSLDIDLVFQELPDKEIQALSLEQYVLLVLYDLWPNPGTWAEGWPGRKELGDALINATEKADLARDQQDTYAEDAEDEEEEEEEEDWSPGYEREEEEDDLPTAVLRKRDREAVRAEAEPEDVEETEEELDPDFGLDPSSDRRDQRLKVRSGHSESLAERFRRKTLPLLDPSILQGCLTPWDREYWEQIKTSTIQERSRWRRPGRRRH